MVNRVEGNEMESPVAQWGWQVGQGGRDPGRPPRQCIIPWHWTRAMSLHALHKMAVAHRCDECVWSQLPAVWAEGKKGVWRVFTFCTHWLGGFIHGGLWMYINVAGIEWGPEKCPCTVHTVPSGATWLYPCSTATHGGSKYTPTRSISCKRTAAWISLKIGPSLKPSLDK